MKHLGYVVIEYNQASHWPSLHLEALYETEDEARTVAEEAHAHYREIGRGETFTVAEVMETA